MRVDTHGDGEFYTSYANMTPIDPDDDGYQMPYSDLMVTGKILYLIKELGGKSEYFYLAIWTVEDPETINLIKQTVKACVEELSIESKYKKFYETCILDSKALSSEERILFNVENFPHDKYANEELSKKISQCANLPGLYLFAPIFPEKIIQTRIIDNDNDYNLKIPNNFAIANGINIKLDETKINTSMLQSVKFDKYLNDRIGTDVCIITKVKNTRHGGKKSKLTNNKRAKTSFVIGGIF